MQIAHWFLLVAYFSQAAMLSAAVSVGALGDPEHLVITGAATFSPRQIKDALFYHSEFPAAADAAAPLDDYLKTLVRLIGAGYRQAGFPDVKVTANVDPKTHSVAINVKEGVRYPAGEVRVRGAKTIPVAQFVERLAKPYVSGDAIAKSWTQHKGETTVCWTNRKGDDITPSDPVWQPGKPAPFLTGPEPDSPLHRGVADALADLGYFFAKFSVDVTADAASKKARLVVNISDEGARCLFGDVHVEGNEANSREDILKYIAFQPAAPATRDEAVRFQEKLWRSGRFIKSEVALASPATPDSRAALLIHVVELHGATPLSKPLSREEDALLKCRDWIADSDHWDGDLVLHCEGDDGKSGKGQATIVISPILGLFADVSYNDAPSPKLIEYATVLSPEEIGVYCRSGGRKLMTGPLGWQLLGNVGLRLDDNANDSEEGKHNLIFGFGANSDRPDSQSPLKWNMVFDPVFFLDMAHRDEAKYTVRDGTLTMSAADETLRVDTASGRLLEYRWATTVHPIGSKASGPSDRKTSQKPSEGDSKITIAFVRGEFRRRVDAIHIAAAKTPNGYEARRPISSLLSFLCDDDRAWRCLGLADDPRVRHVARLMLDKNVCEPFDKIALKYLAGDGINELKGGSGYFPIPERAALPPGINQDYARYTAILTAIAHELFRPGSWPDAACHGAWRMAIGQGELATGELKKLYESYDAGPLCFLAAGALLEGSNPSMAHQMIFRGLERLSAENFHKEYSAFLDPQYPMGQSISRMAALVRELDDGDVQSLGALLPENLATPFRQWAQELRHGPPKPDDQAVPTLLDALWRSGLRENVKTFLEVLQNYSLAYGAQGSPDKTIADTTQAIRLHGNDIALYRFRAFAYMSKNEYDKAIADCTEVLRVDSKDGWAHYTRGKAYGENRDFGKAIADYTEAMRLDSKHLKECCYARVSAYAQLGEYDKAIADCTELVKLDPKDANAYCCRGVLYQQKAGRDRQRNQAVIDRHAPSNSGLLEFQIMPDYDKAVGETPKSSVQGAKALDVSRILDNNNLESAIADHTEAIRLNPKLAEAYYNRGLVYREKGDNSKAEADMAEATKLRMSLR